MVDLIPGVADLIPGATDLIPGFADLIPIPGTEDLLPEMAKSSHRNDGFSFPERRILVPGTVNFSPRNSPGTGALRKAGDTDKTQDILKES